VGLVNTTAGAITVEVSFYSGVNILLGTRTYTLRPFESIQRTDVFGEPGAANLDDGYAVVRTTTSAGRFLAYASVVDNRSGDPIYIPAR
jgi:hypothetical protein